jgi:hypothetical protein
MEESGAKWGIERFYRGRRNVLAAKPPYPKPSYLPNLHIGAALYTRYRGLSKVIKLLENQEKSIERFGNYGKSLYNSGIFFPAS